MLPAEPRNNRVTHSQCVPPGVLATTVHMSTTGNTPLAQRRAAEAQHR
jgi:hypothetical protein